MASKNAKQQGKLIAKDLTKVDEALNILTATIKNINGGIEYLVPENVALKDRSVIERDSQGLELKYQGTDKKTSNAVQRTIEKQIEQKYRSISYYTSGGLYKKLFMAKQNHYIMGEFPDLDKSLNLFMTDVNYGSYFSANDNTNQTFNIRKDGVVVTDKTTVDTIVGFLDPKDGKKEDANSRSFTDLDFEASKLSRRDGYSFVRIIPTAKVLTDLYIKFILKNNKAKTSAKDFKYVKANSLESLDMINEFLEQSGYKSSISMESNLNVLPAVLLKSIPDSLLKEEDVTAINKRPLDKDGHERKPYNFEENEEFTYASESFQDFSYRMLTGKCSPISFYSNSSEKKEKKHAFKVGFESHSLEVEDGHKIYNDIFGPKSPIDLNVFESGLESLSTKLTIFDSELISKTTFEEIYSLNITEGIENIKDYLTEVCNYALESVSGKKPFDKPEMISMGFDNIVKKLVLTKPISVAAIESEMVDLTEYARTKDIGLEKTITPSFRSIIDGNMELDKPEQFLTKGKASVRTLGNAKYDDSIEKIFKQFSHIKGCTSLLLDNRRVVPIMVGNKNNGILYIEKTHAEVEHLIASRSVVTNPIAGGDSSLSMFQIDEERKEETVGRLVFSDTIKPVLERNFSTRFLRENADLMYTVKELLEENEISRSDRSLGVFSDLGFFNLSKVSYIPPSELVMYTNGDGLGESMIEKAFVPANAYILSREAYLSWILVDGKGMIFITYPKGLSDLGGEYGGDIIADSIEDATATRMSLKMGCTDNMRLSKPVIRIPVDENDAGSKIDVREVKPPDFEIDHETIGRWKEEATGIVGYPASLFTDINNGGTHPELARKMESLDASIVLDITRAQDKKVCSSNALATRLLHLRGGKEYESYTVEWVPPRPARSQNNIKKEIAQEKKEVLDAYEAMFDTLMVKYQDWEAVKPYFLDELKLKLFADDKILTQSDSIYKDAKGKMSAALASSATEEE